MRLATIKQQGRETAAVVTDRGLVTFEELNRTNGSSWPTELFMLISSGQSGQGSQTGRLTLQTGSSDNHNRSHT